MRRLIGIGYRHHWAGWIDSRPPEVGCLEITAEHFFDHGEARLRWLGQSYPTFVHGLGISLGTPGPLDRATLANFARIVEIANPLWISEHVAFTRTSELDLGHLNPIIPNRDTLSIMVDHALELSQTCNKPLILENITSHLRLQDEFSETQFLNRLCEAANCGLLLDITNLFINSRNHRFDPHAWLRELDVRNLRQLHLVGYGLREGTYHDDHSAPIQDELLDLAQFAIELAPVEAIIVERDANFPANDVMAAELTRLRERLSGC